MAIKSNLDDFVKKLKQKSDALIEDVKGIVELNTNDLAIQAIRNAPSGGDLINTEFGTQTQDEIRRNRSWSPISQCITFKIVDKGLKGVVSVEQSAGLIAAWVEFGTGQSAQSYLSTVDDEWRAEAQRFYINGKGTIINQPYLYPAFMKYKVQFIKDLKDALKEIAK